MGSSGVTRLVITRVRQSSSRLALWTSREGLSATSCLSHSCICSKLHFCCLAGKTHKVWGSCSPTSRRLPEGSDPLPPNRRLVTARRQKGKRRGEICDLDTVCRPSWQSPCKNDEARTEGKAPPREARPTHTCSECWGRGRRTRHLIAPDRKTKPNLVAVSSTNQTITIGAGSKEIQRLQHPARPVACVPSSTQPSCPDCHVAQTAE